MNATNGKWKVLAGVLLANRPKPPAPSGSGAPRPVTPSLRTDWGSPNLRPSSRTSQRILLPSCSRPGLTFRALRLKTASTS
jgi:hypothetical protein